MFDQNKFVIVYYDTLEEVGNHSLVYDVNTDEICFFDILMQCLLQFFEQQRRDGICRQVIVVEENDYIES